MPAEEFWDLTLAEWSILGAGFVASIGVIKGLMEYTKNSRIKRAEFLEKLIIEFNDKKMFLAKRILDDFWLLLEYDPDKYKPESIDEELVKEGSIKKIEKEELKRRVKDLLRSHIER